MARSGHEYAPSMLEKMEVSDRRTRGMVERWSSVRAKRMAVEEMVEMESERRNQARRNLRSWGRWVALLSVCQNDFTENVR